MIENDKDKPSLDELAHFGVLGMKWGHRRRATGSQIHGARMRVTKENAKIQNQRDKLHSLTPGTAARAKEAKKLGNMKVSALKNPDRVISARMTRGEKTAAVVLGLVVAPIGLPVAVAGIAGTSARSRVIENKQDKGKYNPKK